MNPGPGVKLRRALLLLMAGGILLVSAPAQATPAFRRFALVVGANDGGSGRTKLRYAHTDARAFAKVLRQLGGVKRADLIVMLNPTKMAMLGGIYNLRTKLKAAKQKGVRVEAIFYYSGHSDEKGILLRGKRLKYKAIRTAIGDFPADLRIAILDSCASGALTRLKGGRRRPPFMVDKSSDVKGKAFLTSASASEGAQESDRIKGSYFTHYLISGLRGAADKNHDGKVTLTEAYKYAFHQTLKRTQSSRAGPQHANYDFQLTGSGDLVLTDLRRITARLLLASGMSGRLYIRDHKGRLVAEVVKRSGKPMTIGLAAGKYTVLLTRAKRQYKHKLVIRKNGRFILTRSQMTVATASEAVILRGSGPGGALGVPATVQKRSSVRRRVVNVALLPWLSVNALVKGRAHNHFNFAFLCSRGARLTGFDLALGCSFWSRSARGIQIALGFTHVGGDVGGLQISGGYGSAMGGMTGVQISGGLALALGRSYGVQVAGGLAFARALTGVQIASVNVTTKGLYGVAIGAVNISGDFRGLQLSAVNVAAGRTKGMQLGAVNYARKASGLQLGVVNIVQEGDGLVPIGLINYVGNGILQPTFWSAGTSAGNLGLKMGSKRFYGLFGVGMHPREYTPEGGGEKRNGTITSFIFGFGAHIDFKWWRMYMDIDLVGQKLFGEGLDSGHSNYVAKLRTMLGFRIVRQFSIYAGPTLEMLLAQDLDRVGFASATLWKDIQSDALDPSDTYLNKRLGLSFVVGIQYEPRFGKMNKFW